MSTAKLRALFAAGRTYDEIAEANFRSEGWRPSRSGVKRKYEAMGMPPRRPSNKELLPWQVKTEHNSHLFRHMLSAESRNRRREKLTETDRKLISRMNELLFGRGTPLVIGYAAECPDGFFLALRRDEDTDIIRAPDSASVLRMDVQAALRDAVSDRELATVALREKVRPEVLENAGRDSAADLLRQLIAGAGQPAAQARSQQGTRPRVARASRGGQRRAASQD